MDDDHTPTGFLPMRLRLHPGDHVIDVTKPDVLLGRQSDADLRMPQPDVSRHHCRFQFGDGEWHVVDLDSLNGVYVNGVRVRRTAVIQAGDQLRICGIALDVEMNAASSPADTPADVLGAVNIGMPQPTLHRRAS